MLTAGHRQNDGSTPADGLVQGVVRGRVAGVQAHHHIHAVHPLIRGNVAHQEGQSLIAVFFRQLAAGGNDILLQIQADHAHIKALLLMQEIIHGKGQIGLAASKIHHGDLPVCGQMRHHVRHKFQKTVDLPELVLLSLHQLSLRGHEPQIHQKRQRLIRGQQIRLLPVMGQIPGCRFRLLLLPPDCHVALLARQHRDQFPRHLDLQLGKFPVQQTAQLSDHLFLLIIIVKNLLLLLGAGLEHQVIPDDHRPDLHLQDPAFFSRPADRRLDQVKG